MDKNEIDKMLSELDDIEAKVKSVDKNDFEEILKSGKDITDDKSIVSSVASSDINELKEKLDKLNERLDNVEALKKDIAYIRGVIDDKLNLDFYAMYENVMEHMDVEAVKIYRNIQAVIVEENAKQNHALFDIDGKSNSLKKRLNNVIIFSIVSFVVSILVMFITILPAFGIHLF